MLRACFPIVPDAFRTFAYAIGVLGVISIIYGAFVALGQTDFKRMVAYSSVSHMGYVLLGFAALTEWGMSGAALQMFNHGIITSMTSLSSRQPCRSRSSGGSAGAAFGLKRATATT